MVKKVFDKIFKMINILVNTVYALFNTVLVFATMFTSYTSDRECYLMIFGYSFLMLIGVNLLNWLIRHLIRNY